jgi:hypothetical protein
MNYKTYKILNIIFFANIILFQVKYNINASNVIFANNYTKIFDEEYDRYKRKADSFFAKGDFINAQKQYRNCLVVPGFENDSYAIDKIKECDEFIKSKSNDYKYVKGRLAEITTIGEFEKLISFAKQKFVFASLIKEFEEKEKEINSKKLSQAQYEVLLNQTKAAKAIEEIEKVEISVYDFAKNNKIKPDSTYMFWQNDAENYFQKTEFLASIRNNLVAILLKKQPDETLKSKIDKAKVLNQLKAKAVEAETNKKYSDAAVSVKSILAELPNNENLKGRYFSLLYNNLKELVELDDLPNITSTIQQINGEIVRLGYQNSAYNLNISKIDGYLKAIENTDGCDGKITGDCEVSGYYKCEENYKEILKNFPNCKKCKEELIKLEPKLESLKEDELQKDKFFRSNWKIADYLKMQSDNNFYYDIEKSDKYICEAIEKYAAAINYGTNCCKLCNKTKVEELKQKLLDCDRYPLLLKDWRVSTIFLPVMGIGSALIFIKQNSNKEPDNVGKAVFGGLTVFCALMEIVTLKNKPKKENNCVKLGLSNNSAGLRLSINFNYKKIQNKIKIS